MAVRPRPLARGGSRDSRADRDSRSRFGARDAAATTRSGRWRSSRRRPGPVVDVGSGGGTPGIPLAVALPDRVVTLLDAERRKCRFLETLAGRDPEPRGRLGARRGAGARAIRRGRGEGARPPADRGRVVPPARPRGRPRRPLGRRGRGARAGRRGCGADRRACSSPPRRACSRSARRVRRRPGFPRRTGVAKKRPLA